jgi:hypothetical protein
MNCIIKSGVNDCRWNIDGRCTNYKVTKNKQIHEFSRDWDSKQNCVYTQLGVYICGGYLSAGKVP